MFASAGLELFFPSHSPVVLGGYKNLLYGEIFKNSPLNTECLMELSFYYTFAKGDCTEWEFGLVYSLFWETFKIFANFLQRLLMIKYLKKKLVKSLS